MTRADETDGRTPDCETVVRSLWAYLDGETSEEDALGLERHLARCESCRSHAEFEARLVGELVRIRRNHSDSEHLRARVLRALRRAGMPAPDSDLEEPSGA